MFNLDLTEIALAWATIVGGLAAVVGYFLMRRKFLKALSVQIQKEKELAQKVYEIAVLKEIGDRIGYSLDATKIVEIISGSLGQLLPYSTVTYMIIRPNSDKVGFFCNVKESVSSAFIADVKTKMIAAFSAMTQESLTEAAVDQSISGTIVDEVLDAKVKSFFNLPIVILGKLVGIINVSSFQENLYNEANTAVLYRIARQASDAVSRLQEVLENEKSRLSQAVQSLADGLLMVDVNYQLVIVNKRLVQLLLTVENPKIFDIVNALSGQLDLRTNMEEAIAKNQISTPQEIVVHDKVLQVVFSPVVDLKQKKPLGVVVLFHDVTDAEALEKLKQDFTSMMVHELRAPLTSIKSSVELLKTDGSKAAELPKYLKIIDSTAQTMLELVNDLLDVAKMEAGKFDVIAENGDVGEVVIERAESFKPQAETKNLKLNVEIEENLPQVYFDKIRTKQILNNLFSNALKYTEVGEITIKVAKEISGGQAVDILVSVVDTGIGIEPDQVPRLFSRFGQLADGRKQAALKSSGLGLYIAKSIVEAQGGKIGVKSQGTGLGSTFYFTIPLAAKMTVGQTSQDRPIAMVSKVAQA